MLGERRRRWVNIKPTLGECLVFAGRLELLINIVEENTSNTSNVHKFG